MLHASSPAPIVETLELVRVGRHLKPAHSRILVYQILKSTTVGVRDQAGRLVAACGFVELTPERDGERRLEAWFACRRELGRDMLPFVRGARLTIAQMQQSGPVRIVAHVREGHAPGERLARMLGMHLAETLHGFGRWETVGGQSREGPLRRG